MQAARQGTQGGLLKILGYGFGVAVVVGSTIGSGILAAPGTLAREFGSVGWSLAVWVGVSIYALLGTKLMAELGVWMPKAGAWSVYARRAFGDSTGFAIGWMNWLMLAGTASSLAAFIATLISQLAPSLSSPQSRTLISVAAVVAFTLLHWTGTRSGSLVQIITSLIKAAAFLALVVACFAIGGDAPSSFSAPTLPSAPVGIGALVLALVAALQIVIFAFDGWYGAIYFAEEDRDPARNLPRSMVNGTWAIIAIYLLVVLAIFRVLPLERISGAEIAAATAADEVFGGGGGKVILFISLISVPSVLNATLLQAMRVLYALACDGIFHPAARSVNPWGTPVIAMLLGSGVTIAMLLMNQGAFEKLYAITSYFMVIIYLSGFFSFWRLRHSEPDVPRGYRAPWHPWSTLFVVITSLAFLGGALYSDTLNVVWALGLLAAAYPAYYLLRSLGMGKGA